jgi:hypothetical protein
MNTRKKVKVIGAKTYIDHETGELQEMQIVSIEERDANFHKIWLSHVIQSLDIIGNQKIRLAFWLLDQMDSENKIAMTQRQMAEGSSISLFTVKHTIKALLESNFLVKHNIGVYKINPDMIFKGSKDNRLNVMLSYTDSKIKTTRQSNP